MNFPLLTPVSPRDPGQTHRTATPLELLTDLCFVVAIAQAALSLHHEVTEGHPLHGLTYFAVAFFALYWAWLNFAWFNSAYDPDDVTHRVLTLVQIFGSLVLAAGVPGFFEQDFTLGIIGYVIMRIALVVMWLRVADGHRDRSPTALQYVYGLVLVQAAWVALLVLTGGEVELWQFLLVGLADFSVPLLAERRGSTPWHPEHIAERYGLFFIIVLGETILSVTIALQEAFDEGERPVELWFVVAAGVLITFASWWLYFTRENARILTGNAVGYLWGFGHYVIFGAAAALGAGLAARIDFYGDHADVTDVISAAFVTVPVAILLLALWVLSVRLHDPTWRTSVPFAAASLAVVAVTFVPWSELWTGLIVVVLLVVELRLSGVADDAQQTR